MNCFHFVILFDQFEQQCIYHSFSRDGCNLIGFPVFGVAFDSYHKADRLANTTRQQFTVAASSKYNFHLNISDYV